MSDLPANAIDFGEMWLSDAHGGLHPPSGTEDGRYRIVAIPVAEPPTLAERIEALLERSPVHGERCRSEIQIGVWEWIADARDLLREATVCRDDVPTETLQPLDEDLLTQWLIVNKTVPMADWRGIAEQIVARFGVPARPTVTQVMEALGGEHRDGAWLLHGQRLLPEEYVGDLLVGLGAARPDGPDSPHESRPNEGDE